MAAVVAVAAVAAAVAVAVSPEGQAVVLDEVTNYRYLANTPELAPHRLIVQRVQAAAAAEIEKRQKRALDALRRGVDAGKNPAGPVSSTIQRADADSLKRLFVQDRKTGGGGTSKL